MNQCPGSFRTSQLHRKGAFPRLTGPETCSERSGLGGRAKAVTPGPQGLSRSLSTRLRAFAAPGSLCMGTCCPCSSTTSSFFGKHRRHAGVHAKSLSRVWLAATPWTVAHQAPLPMGFSKQAYRNGLSSPPPGDLSDSGIKYKSLYLLHWQADSLLLVPPGKPKLHPLPYPPNA